MDNNEKSSEPQGTNADEPAAFGRTEVGSVVVNWENTKKFFRLTGGSLLYCLSAVFVAYGIVNVMGPVLEGSETLWGALGCVGTLAVYELALLGVLIAIVRRKVVDDAISIVMIMAQIGRAHV